MATRVVRVGSEITLTVRFYNNGDLFDPYSISDVSILDSQSSTLATLPVTKSAVGIYTVSWDVPLGTTPGYYYDQWIWTAVEGMATKTQTYTFRVDAAIVSYDVTCDNEPLSGGPLFVGDREITFFNSVTKELIQKIVSQKVFYYSVSEKYTKVDDLYDEAIKKTVYTPIEINALILYNEPTQTASQWSIDTIYSIEVYFHIHELQERKVIPREGDFVKFGEIVYEIEKLTQPQMVYGQIDEKVMLKAICRVSRKSQFEVLDNLPAQPDGD